MPPKGAPYYIDPRLHAYVSERTGEDATLARVRDYARANGLPTITPAAGRMLQILARTLGAKRIAEIGTCTGYSTIWLARGLAPRGKIHALEVDAKFIEIARRHFRRARLAHLVEFKEGDAAETLRRLKRGAYDLVFIDADKENYPLYLKEAIRIVRTGGIIAADNMFWGGDVLDAAATDDGTEALREYTRLATTDRRLLTILCPLGDGLGISVKLR